jgi:hypothetical protein
MIPPSCFPALLTTDQRRQLRDYVCAIGVGKAPVLLEILSGIGDTNDFELLRACVVASIFHGQTPRQTTEFLRERGICDTDIARVFDAVLVGAQGPERVHGWN